MSQDNFSQSSNASHRTTYEAQQILDVFWEREMDDIRSLEKDDFKSLELPLARIKKIMKLDEEVELVSMEATILFAKAAELFVTELSLRAWLHTEENRRRTLQKNDIAVATMRHEEYDFLIDIVPRDGLNRPKEQKKNEHTDTTQPDQVQYLQLAPQQQTSGVSQEGLETQIQPRQVQYFQPQQELEAFLQQQQISGISQRSQQTQIQQAQPQQFQLNPSQLQLIRMQGQNTNQQIIIHAAPVQQNASQVQQTATQVVYQIQQATQASGQVDTSGTPVVLIQNQSGSLDTLQIQADTADQHPSPDE